MTLPVTSMAKMSAPSLPAAPFPQFECRWRCCIGQRMTNVSSDFFSLPLLRARNNSSAEKPRFVTRRSSERASERRVLTDEAHCLSPVLPSLPLLIYMSVALFSSPLTIGSKQGTEEGRLLCFSDPRSLVARPPVKVLRRAAGGAPLDK